MKKIILLLIIGIIMFYTPSIANVSPVQKVGLFSQEVETPVYHAPVVKLKEYYCFFPLPKSTFSIGAGIDVLTAFQDVEPPNLPDPNFTFEDIGNIPKGGKTMDWVKYVIGILLLLFYEFGASKLKTKKSITITGILYRFSNWFVKDKSKGGGEFVIKKK